MKLSKLVATEVHGYLPIEINFYDDLTFLIGLNGAGKTSALRLISGLLTPNLEDLVSIEFSSASVTVVDGSKPLSVNAFRTPDGLSISLDNFTQSLEISATEMQYIMDSRFRSEPHSPILERIIAHPVVRAIKSLPTPMYLGIDRRAAWANVGLDEFNASKRHLPAVRRAMLDESFKGGTNVGGLAEVNALLRNKIQEIRAEQVKLDDELRIKLFTKAFEYKPSNLLDAGIKGPSRAEVAQYKVHLENIERVSETLKLDAPSLKASLSGFFDSMNRVVVAMEKQALKEKAHPARHGPKTKRWEEPPAPKTAETFDKDYVEWLINSPQADRVMESLQLLDEFVKARAELNKPIVRFFELINGFLDQTHKKLSATQAGNLQIDFVHGNSSRQVMALASGERQLVVMLAHLSLNPDLAGSGVFIVDEPELSLHIDWQEKFVDAIIEANPSVQIILATHSPAIVLDRVDRCVDSIAF